MYFRASSASSRRPFVGPSARCALPCSPRCTPACGKRARRWSRRRAEDQDKFVSTQNFVATKPLRSSLERREDQTAVWAAVAFAKDKMSQQLPGYLGSTVSPSSLQLSLEDSILQKNVKEGFQSITGQFRLNTKTVGALITINNRLERIEWYGHARLFRRLWPGLGRAAPAVPAGSAQRLPAST